MEENKINPMQAHTMGKHTGDRPKIAIIDNNMLAMMGLKTILLNVMPIADINTFCTFCEMEAAGPDSFMHYFVALKVVLEQTSFLRTKTRPSFSRHLPTPTHNSRALRAFALTLRKSNW